MEERQLLTAGDVARFWKIHPKTVYWLASRGRIPSVRLGPRCVRFRREDLERIVAEHLVSAERS